MNKLIIAGSRTFYNIELLELEVKRFVVENKIERPTIISGHAQGADMLGEQFAQKHKLNLEIFPADWDQYGKRAGPIRNEEMAKYASHLIAFFSGSRGTKNMIETAYRYKLITKIINY